jgi:hypothetical protein
METSSARMEKFKTKRFPEVDVILGTQLSIDEQGKLVDIFKNGLPMDYSQYKNSSTYVDSLENPRLLVKQRVLDISDLRDFREGRNFESYCSGDINAAVSLLNEMRRADEVEKLLTHPDAQQFAQELGYREFTVIKPVMGFIHRQSGNKYMVYPFVDGESLLRQHPEIYFEDEKVVRKLAELFLSHGIRPTDLYPKQFLVNNTHLYLLDLELYNRVFTKPPAQTSLE